MEHDSAAGRHWAVLQRNTVAGVRRDCSSLQMPCQSSLCSMCSHEKQERDGKEGEAREEESQRLQGRVMHKMHGQKSMLPGPSGSVCTQLWSDLSLSKCCTSVDAPGFRCWGLY